jgi:hypothetical protein
MVLKNLTIQFPRPLTANDFDSVSRAFPGDRSHFGPVFPHLSCHYAAKTSPKTLTFDSAWRKSSARHVAKTDPPEFPHLLQAADRFAPQRRLQDRARTQSGSRKVSPQAPKYAEIGQKCHSSPVKSHRRFAFAPDLSHLWG